MSARWERTRGGGRARPPGVRADFPGRAGRSGARGEARAGGRRSIQDRLDGALVDVAVHRTVAYRDLVDRHFDGHPYAARRGVDRLVRAGFLVQEKATGPKGGSFLVVHPTRRGAEAARSLAAKAGLDPDQRSWDGPGRQGDLVHDTAIYRAVQEHRAALRRDGGRVVRIRLDAELRGIVAKRSEEARVRAGRDAADLARRRAARALGLPVLESGRVLYPDAQVEYRSEDGDIGRVNIEIATEHYRSGDVAAKARAGFAVHASSGRALRTVLAGLRRAAAAAARAARGGGGGSGGGGRGDEPATVEL